ncbi:GatB/YqeY domain-containing protein [Trujillonella humicola]|uniref:GatB/YqeY domain-containing protein n=1 Tax=Trujillonella humicola TaxID=3383699 RepID=UPI003905BC5C
MPDASSPAATDLKKRLRADLTTAMKARDELRTATLRMVLAAVSAEEVSGKEARELSDAEVQAVVRREAKKRREAAEAFAGAGRAQQAERERAEEGVLAGYLPAQLDDADLAALVADVVTTTGAAGMKDMGRVMGAATAAVAGRAEGARVAAEVRRQLA